MFKPRLKWVNIDSLAPNELMKQQLMSLNYDVVKPEHTFGASRFDFYMERDGEKYLTEVKGCTLAADLKRGIGLFPDAPTEGGVKHLDELTAAAKEGYHCQIVFVIQMNGIHMVFPNDDTQPEFGQALVRAAKAGVQVVYYSCHVEADSIRITGVGDDTSRYAGRLWRALNGRHPYRYFKDAINETGVAQKYYDFRSMTYLHMAEEWCREHKVRYFRKDGKN